ncbi:MAG: hypothetical protein IPK07_17105 [Deltaproteobacteria bacterium]|nr:hypothetical protein [Deltaproteobacteria bacterium]
MITNRFHVGRLGVGWTVRRESDPGTLMRFPTQSEAEVAAQARCRGALDVVVVDAASSQRRGRAKPGSSLAALEAMLRRASSRLDESAQRLAALGAWPPTTPDRS